MFDRIFKKISLKGNGSKGVSSRLNVNGINKVVDETGIEQINFNIFILMRDICFTDRDILSGNGSISDMPIKKDSYFYFNDYDFNNFIEFIKELITPEVIKSRFVSDDELKFIRDVYSMDGKKIQTFKELKNKYGDLEFDINHKLTIHSLQTIFSVEGDLAYFEKYSLENNYLLDQLILFDTIEEKRKYKFDNPTIEPIMSIEEAIKMVYTGKYDKNDDETIDEYDIDELEKRFEVQKDKLLLFFLQKEFMLEKSQIDYDDLDERNNKYGSNVEENNERLRAIIESDSSSFINHINEKYNIVFTPTDKMIDEFEKFKNYYRQCKMLEQKNDLLYEKNKIENNANIMYNGVELLERGNSALLEMGKEYNDLLNNSMNGIDNKKGYTV